MNVLLLDDHTLFRDSLRRLLEGTANWQVVGDFGRADQALTAIDHGLTFDLALIDYELEDAPPWNNGLLVAAQFRRKRPNCPILMVTAGMPTRHLTEAVQDARVGVFLKSEPSEELFLAMRRTLRGELWVSSSVTMTLMDQPASMATRSGNDISDRDGSVLGMLLEGLTNKEIGARLSISEAAVKGIMQTLFAKAGVRSRSQLVAFAISRQAGIGR